MVFLPEIFSPIAILSIGLTTFLVSPVRVAEISSKIDLDDDEATTPPATLSSSVLKAFVDIHQEGAAGPAPKPERITVKEPPRGFGKLVERPADNPEVRKEYGGDYISIEDLFKGQKRQQIQRNPYGVEGFYGASDVRPTIINNIHVTINANDSSPGVNGCKNGLCDVTVTSKPDSEGNVITNVHLSVVTKLKKSPQLEISDVPVIEGIAGIGNPPFDQIPAFHFVDQNVGHGGGPIFDNNIPQIPIHRQDIDSWHHPAIQFPRLRPVWQYGRNFERGFGESRAARREFQRWSNVGRREGIVDDKIETPLSKTANPNSE